MTALRWTAKSLRTLAGQLRAQGRPASATLVQRLRHEARYGLQANAKTLEGSQHPDRDAQFRHIHDTAAAFLAAGDPVVSVDAKKKQNVGQFKNGGRKYQPKGSPVRVNVHDFPGDADAKAIPYGVYGIGANTGWVSAGTDHETARSRSTPCGPGGTPRAGSPCPGARRLLITADSGGSNGSRRRAWKTGLAALAAGTGLEISVCHLPPGTSKWNK